MRRLGSVVVGLFVFQVAADLRERIEIVHTHEYPAFLRHLFPAFRELLLQRLPVALSPDTAEARFRLVLLEILNRLPNNEALRPYAQELLHVATEVGLAWKKDSNSNSKARGARVATGRANRSKVVSTFAVRRRGAGSAAREGELSLASSRRHATYSDHRIAPPPSPSPVRPPPRRPDWLAARRDLAVATRRTARRSAATTRNRRSRACASCSTCTRTSAPRSRARCRSFSTSSSASTTRSRR